MSSTSPDLEISQELKLLFSWNPCRLFRASRQNLLPWTPSTRILPPTFFDKHLSDRLVLKHVKRLPSLVHDIANTVDIAIAAAASRGIQLPPQDGSFSLRRYILDDLCPSMEHEEHVASFYERATFTFCASVASTLALHLNASTLGWRSLMRWSWPRDRTAGYAMADRLFLFRTDEMSTGHQALLGTMNEETRVLYLALRKRYTSLATWEFKHLAAGDSQDTMLEIPNLSNMDPFAWTRYPERNCRFDLKHPKERETVTEIKPGPDATLPLWNLNKTLSNFHANSSGSHSHSEEIAETSPPTPSLTLSLESPQNTRRSARIAQAVLQAASSMPPPPVPTVALGEPVSQTDETGQDRAALGKRKRDTDREVSKGPKDVPAQCIVQHAWMRAVLEDTTIIVLNSGNHEVVCVRERATQTLYVSDVSEPSTCKDPAYGKLHVGIYIAAIQDAMDRVKQLPNDDKNSADHGDESKGTDDEPEVGRYGGNSRGGHSDRKRGKGRDQSMASNSKDKIASQKKTIVQANRRNLAFLYLQYGIYDSPIPATFVRSAPSIGLHRAPPPSLHVIDSALLGDCLSIVLTSEVGEGGTGIVLGGKLEVQATQGCVPLDVVVKLAFTGIQEELLRSEYEIYQRLYSKGVVKGIPTVLGLFDDSEGGPPALVMSFAGISLAAEPKHISPSQHEAALATLKSIHRAGVLHGDIRRHNLLVDDTEVTIIDFDRSTMCNDQRAMDRECAQLRYILDEGSESEDEGDQLEGDSAEDLPTVVSLR